MWRLCFWFGVLGGIAALGSRHVPLMESIIVCGICWAFYAYGYLSGTFGGVRKERARILRA